MTDDELRLDCLLKEAELLQSEMNARLERQAQSLYFCVVLLGAAIGAAATALTAIAALAVANKNDIAHLYLDLADRSVSALLIFLPLLIFPLAGMFFDDELLRGITDHFLCSRLAKSVRSLVPTTNKDPFPAFNHSLKDRFRYWHKDLGLENYYAREAAEARRLIFFVPYLIAGASFLWLLSIVVPDAVKGSIRYVTVAIAIVGVLMDIVLFRLQWNLMAKASKIWRMIIAQERVENLAALDWSQCTAVERVRDRRSGAWVFRGTRMPVATVFENLEAGSDIEEIIEQFHVTREQVQAVLEFAARSLDPPAVPVGATTAIDAHSL